MPPRNQPNRKLGPRTVSEFSLGPAKSWSSLFNANDDDNNNNNNNPKPTPLSSDEPIAVTVNTSRVKKIGLTPSDATDKTATAVRHIHQPFQPPSCSRIELSPVIEVEVDQPFADDAVSALPVFVLPRAPTTDGSPQLPSDEEVQESQELEHSGSEETTENVQDIQSDNLTQAERRRFMTRNMSPTELIGSPISSDGQRSVCNANPVEKPVELRELGVQTIPKPMRPHRIRKNTPIILSNMNSSAESHQHRTKMRSRRIQKGSPQIPGRMVSPNSTNYIVSSTAGSVSGRSIAETAISDTAISDTIISERKINTVSGPICPRRTRWASSIAGCGMCPHKALAASMLEAIRRHPRGCPWPSSSTMYNLGESTGLAVGSVAEALGSLALGVLTGVGRTLLSKENEKETDFNDSELGSNHIENISRRNTQSVSYISRNRNHPQNRRTEFNGVFDGIICAAADLPNDVIGIPVQDSSKTEDFMRLSPTVKIKSSVGGQTGLNIFSGKAAGDLMTESYVHVIPPGQSK